MLRLFYGAFPIKQPNSLLDHHSTMHHLKNELASHDSM